MTSERQHNMPPLHRKYDEAEALAAIKRRYKGLKGKIDAQLRILRADEDFLARCTLLYEQGYKDWHILEAVWNRMATLELQRRGVRLDSADAYAEFVRMFRGGLEDVVYSPDQFTGPEWDVAFQMHAMACLKSYGFELRATAFRPEALLKFLRMRMRFYDHDVPHRAMFGKPPGAWPR